MHFTQRRGRRLQVGKVGGGREEAEAQQSTRIDPYPAGGGGGGVALVSLWHSVTEQADARP